MNKNRSGFVPGDSKWNCSAFQLENDHNSAISFLILDLLGRNEHQKISPGSVLKCAKGKDGLLYQIFVVLAVHLVFGQMIWISRRRDQHFRDRESDQDLAHVWLRLEIDTESRKGQ